MVDDSLILIEKDLHFNTFQKNATQTSAFQAG